MVQGRMPISVLESSVNWETRSVDDCYAAMYMIQSGILLNRSLKIPPMNRAVSVAFG